jgi:catechol 2,3-dioxygenase-like lactoylglutathione lyase family enzyme
MSERLVGEVGDLTEADLFVDLGVRSDDVRAVPLEEGPRWRGVHHLALTTNDMDATVRFYHGVLGMRIVATIGTDTFRHYFFEVGPGSTVAFFEFAGVDVGAIEKPAGVPPDYPTQFDHVSFHVPDERALEQLRDRLIEFAVEVTDVVDHEIMKSVYFTDPNGIALEASCWITDVTGRGADYRDRSLVFADRNPVPALVELEKTGELDWTPSTHLVGDLPDGPVDPA